MDHRAAELTLKSPPDQPTVIVSGEDRFFICKSDCSDGKIAFGGQRCLPCRCAFLVKIVQNGETRGCADDQAFS